MGEVADLQFFVDDPCRLIDLCRQVVQRLTAAMDAAATPEKKRELQEVEQIITSLEKLGIPPPAELAVKREQLLAALTPPEEVQQQLEYLRIEFSKILEELPSRTRKLPPTPPPEPRRPRSPLPHTHMNVFKEQVVMALRKLGGRGEATAVIEEVGKQLQGKFTPGDREWSATRKMYAWQHKTHWARYHLVQEGVLRKDSPRGIWELTDQYL